MKSSPQHSFAQIPRAEIQRSKFNRSHGVKTTFDSGYLIPIFADEVLPGDTFNLRMHTFARLATPLHPVMDNMHLDSQFFFVPLRLIWDDFKRMMGEQDDPADSTDFTVPQITSTCADDGTQAQTLSDYLGIPTATPASSITHSSLFHRAYNLIYQEWYRSEDLQDQVVVDKDAVLTRKGTTSSCEETNDTITSVRVCRGLKNQAS